MNTQIFSRINKNLKMDRIQNLDVKAKWVQLGIKLKVDGFVDKAKDILSSFGRVKYLKPIYMALMKNGYEA